MTQYFYAREDMYYDGLETLRRIDRAGGEAQYVLLQQAKWAEEDKLRAKKAASGSPAGKRQKPQRLVP